MWRTQPPGSRTALVPRTGFESVVSTLKALEPFSWPHREPLNLRGLAESVLFLACKGAVRMAGAPPMPRGVPLYDQVEIGLPAQRWLRRQRRLLSSSLF